MNATTHSTTRADRREGASSYLTGEVLTLLGGETRAA